MAAPPIARSALALAALVAVASPAAAGEAVKLAVEFPPDVRHLEPGDTLDVVQVVGIDAAGARVGFGGKTVRLTASAGSTRVVEAPFRFGFTAPTEIDGPTAVTFTAVLEGVPGVSGTARLDILPAGPYVRLSLTPDRTRVDWGESTTLRVEGEEHSGRLVPVVKGKLRVTVEGPGEVTFVRLGAYRFTAPDRPPAGGGTEALLVAVIDGHPAVRGRTSVALGAPGIRLPPTKTATSAEETRTKTAAGSSDPGPSESGSRESGGNGTPGAEKPAKPAKPAKDGGQGGKRRRDRTAEKDDRPRTSDGEVEAVAWPGGAIGVLAWRARPDTKKGTRMRRMKRLPAPGAEFASGDAQQRVRALVLAPGDGDIRAEWRLGDAEGRLEDPPGTLKTLRDRLERRVVVVDAMPPASGEFLRVTIIVATPKGDVRDEFVFRRKSGKDGKKKRKREKAGDEAK